MSGFRTLEELRLALGQCAAMLTEHRTDLIESFGDSLCGSGEGPNPAAVERLHALEKTHDALRLAYREGLRFEAQAVRC